MALVYCPECGTKVSDTAASCPFCGYRSADSNQPMITNTVPPQQISWGGDALTAEFGDVFPIGERQTHDLNTIFGRAENLARVAPAFFETLKAMIPETVKVAQIDAGIQKLIDSGVYRFIPDGQGNILPSIFGSHGVVAQVRLKDLKLTPDLSHSIIDLQSQVAMAQVISEIHALRKELANVHNELQDDRLAMVDSAWQQLQQANQITDARVREAKLLNILSSATDAKAKLIRAFHTEQRFFDERSQQGRIKQFLDTSGQNAGIEKSHEIFDTLMAITKTVQVEATGYSLLGEKQAAILSLSQFNQFIGENKLNERDTLLTFNSYSDVDLGDLVEGFESVQQNIAQLSLPFAEAQPLIAEPELNEEESHA